jgi:threonine/homoserine/homoserine lactone efflux protein
MPLISNDGELNVPSPKAISMFSEGNVVIDVSYWLIFFSAAIAVNVAPGPDLIYVLSRAVRHGRKIGLASAAGVCSGALVHVAAASLGISAILATSASAFTIVEYLGAAYLIYLGFRLLFSLGTTFTAEKKTVEAVFPWQALFRQGIIVDVLNPKVAIFFMAFLPQFVRPGNGSASAQLLSLGTLVICIAFAIQVCLVFAASKAADFFRTNLTASVWLDRLFGTFLISLGIRLAVSQQRQ